MKLIFTQSAQKLLLIVIFFILSILSVITSSAQMCTNPSAVIYGLASSGNIVPITVSNATVGANINATPFSGSGSAKANALGYNTTNGTFYYFQNNSSGGSQQFVSYNPATSTYTVLANAPITSTVNRGCVSFSGTGYYCLDQNSNLCYYNIPANTWTLACSNFTDQYGNNVSNNFKSQGSGDMAIDGLGNLWIVSSNSSQWGLYKLSAPLPTASTASMTITQLIAPTTATPTGANFAGIAFDPTGSIYMATDNDLYLLSKGYVISHLGTFSVAGVGSDITSCNYPFGILPVVWENVSATLQNNNTVAINWTIDQQVNNKEYTIEHSADGKSWSDIGKTENENNNTPSQSYSFTDANPVKGNNYYRILQTDIDGSISYSVIKTVDVETSAQIAIWPNPAKNIVNIQKENGSGVYNINAEIFNQSGQKVSASLLHNGINAVNIESLPAGYYIVHVELSNGEKYNQKLVKM
jgi:type IX secretion system substrate protein